MEPIAWLVLLLGGYMVGRMHGKMIEMNAVQEVESNTRKEIWDLQNEIIELKLNIINNEEHVSEESEKSDK